MSKQKGLDLRKKILGIIKNVGQDIRIATERRTLGEVSLEGCVDELLALYPDIEELQKWYDKLLEEFKTLKRERVDKIEEAKKQEGERVLDKLFGDSEIYPAHLKVWAKSIKDDQRYDSTLSATLRRIGKNWQALQEEK